MNSKSSNIMCFQNVCQYDNFYNQHFSIKQGSKADSTRRLKNCSQSTIEPLSGIMEIFGEFREFLYTTESTKSVQNFTTSLISSLNSEKALTDILEFEVNIIPSKTLSSLMESDENIPEIFELPAQNQILAPFITKFTPYGVSTESIKLHKRIGEKGQNVLNENIAKENIRLNNEEEKVNRPAKNEMLCRDNSTIVSISDSIIINTDFGRRNDDNKKVLSTKPLTLNNIKVSKLTEESGNQKSSENFPKNECYTLPKFDNNSANNLSKFENAIEETNCFNFMQKSNMIIPDVYRIRAYTDLYQKMLTQLEMKDSYLTFQKLMSRKETINQYNDQKNILETEPSLPVAKQKLHDSWLFCQTHVTTESDNRRSNKSLKHCVSEMKKVCLKNSNKSVYSCKRKEPSSQKSSYISLKNYSSSNTRCLQNFSVKENTSMKKFVNSSDRFRLKSRSCTENIHKKIGNSKPNVEKTRRKRSQNKTLLARTTKRDALDQISIKNLKPLQSEYPRNDRNGDKKITARNSYLNKLLDNTNQGMWEQLLQLNKNTNENFNDKISETVEDSVLLKNSAELLYSRRSEAESIKTLQKSSIDSFHRGISVSSFLPINIPSEYECLKKNSSENNKDNSTNSKTNSFKSRPSKINRKNTIRKSGKTGCSIRGNCASRDGENEKKWRPSRSRTFCKEPMLERGDQRKPQKKINKEKERQGNRPATSPGTIQKKIPSKGEKRKNLERAENQSTGPQTQIVPYVEKISSGNSFVSNEMEKIIYNLEYNMGNLLKESFNSADVSGFFNLLETDILKLLWTMQGKATICPKNCPTPPRVSTPETLEDMRDDLVQISDDLYNTLDDILDRIFVQTYLAIQPIVEA